MAAALQEVAAAGRLDPGMREQTLRIEAAHRAKGMPGTGLFGCWGSLLAATKLVYIGGNGAHVCLA